MEGGKEVQKFVGEAYETKEAWLWPFMYLHLCIKELYTWYKKVLDWDLKILLFIIVFSR